MSDLFPARYLFAALALLISLLVVGMVILGRRHARARRSLALLVLLVSTLGALAQALTLPLGPLTSLALFLGLFAVIRLMGRFDSPE